MSDDQSRVVPEMQRADPAARRLALLLLLIGVVGGACAFAGLKLGWPSVERWLLSDGSQLPRRIAVLNGVLILVTALPAVALAVHLWRRGARVLRERRFPLEDDRLIRDTPVLRGETAATRGRRMQWMAALLGAAGLALGLALARLAVLLGRMLQ